MMRFFRRSSLFQMHTIFGAFVFGMLCFGVWSGRFSFFQEAFSAPIRGSGTINQVAAFGTTDTIGDSIIFDSGTNVGIGTTNPASRLHVFGGDFSVEQAAGTSNKILFTNDHGAHYIASNGYWIDVVGNQNEVFRVFNGGTELLRVAPSGNVGIGISNPAQELHVSATSGQNADVRITGNGQTANYMDVYHGAVDQGLWGVGPIDMLLATNSNERVRITATGNVGIGTTNPGARLHIGAFNDNHLLLTSANNSYGWRIDTHDFGSGNVPLRIFKRTGGTDTQVFGILNQNGNANFGSNMGINTGGALYLGREEIFGGADTGGNDYGYIKWENDNDTYAYWGNSGENGALIIGAENDGRNSVSDVIALKSNAAVVVDAPELITTGAVFASGVLESRRAADGCNSGIVNLWDTTNDRGWHITNRRGCEGSLNDLKFWFWDGKNWHNRFTLGNDGVVETNPDNVTGGGIKVADDGGFYDYNNGWIDFRGSNGMRILNENGAWDNNRSLRAGALCIRDDCKTNWSQVGGGITSETDPVWVEWRNKPGVTGAADGRSALAGELRSDTLSACHGGSCSHLRWYGDNANYLRGRTFVDADQMEINSGWQDGQRMNLNANQLWKNESGDQTLYFQWTNEDGGVQIGDNADGPGNNLRVYGDVNNAGYIVQSNRYYDDDANFWVDSNVDSKMSSVRFTSKIGFNSCNSINCGVWLWDYGDSNHVIYSANPSGAPGGLAGAWDAGHRFRFRTCGNSGAPCGQGFLWENNANERLMDLDADDGRLWIQGNVGIDDTASNAKLRVNGAAAANVFLDREDFNYFLDPNNPELSLLVRGTIKALGTIQTDQAFQHGSAVGASEDVSISTWCDGSFLQTKFLKFRGGLYVGSFIQQGASCGGTGSYSPPPANNNCSREESGGSGPC